MIGLASPVRDSLQDVKPQAFKDRWPAPPYGGSKRILLKDRDVAHQNTGIELFSHANYSAFVVKTVKTGVNVQYP